MKLTWQCMFSPRLYKIYRDGNREAMYQPQGLEKWGDRVITTANTILNIGIYTSPFICMYIYKRGFFSIEETRNLARFFGGIGCLIAFSFLMRGFGRATNPKYVAFYKALTNTVADQRVYLNNIRKYDFDFRSWPVTYSVPPKLSSSWFDKHPFSNCANVNLPLYQRTTIQVLAYAATHTFGLRLIYPGSVGLVQNLLWSALFQGRAQLVEQFEGKRTKVGTADGNHIDTMFVDNRETSVKGKTLVICCEGNSGFYEIGIMTTPVKAGYSALGWNHPGFAGSTGLPYPEQEHNAIDAVMQYAINELGFKPENIVLFGWSIGGYAAAWAALNYPVKGLVLDATFDDLLPLAENQMPKSWALLVKEVVRSYVDLNIAELVAQYTGPIQLVRRTEDEIICLRQGLLSTNRGNHLLLRLIAARHPDVVTEAAEETTVAPLDKYVSLMDSQRAALERSEVDANDKRNLQLIGRYMRDYKSSHCTPLPEQVFDSVMTNLTSNKLN
ncbi:phosphatidylserine lipase ABHD16A [Pectinophora gossypiella]|uniref:phosphatidylserine lipase ABHD16A n=1 Tax=Pectinophora gossypiella TaxID=13191 RepID=UPI00214F0594|nr:phosphatidylserine lipase ABHD16A [Pectinophora gossypiella]